MDPFLTRMGGSSPVGLTFCAGAAVGSTFAGAVFDAQANTEAINATAAIATRKRAINAKAVVRGVRSAMADLL
jgi:hypothetical protein